MTKSVQCCDVVFDETETAILIFEFDEKVRKLAIKHFVDNEGMTEEEANKRVRPGKIYYDKYVDDPNRTDLINRIFVECEVELSTQEKE